MAEDIPVTSLSELAERLFAKPPALQLLQNWTHLGHALTVLITVISEVEMNLSGEAVFVNAPVSEVEEALKQQLLVTEHCTSSKDEIEYNENVSTGSLLHLLSFVGRHEAMEWLLKNGAHTHSGNHVGSTPLHVAALRNQAEAIKVLRYYHGDIYTENKHGRTALDFASEDDVKDALLAHRFSSDDIEDEFLQEHLSSLVEKVTTVQDSEELGQSLLCLRAEIRVATSSMTSVPKPLKILREHFAKLQETYDKMETGLTRAVLADVLSVLSMATEDKGRICLKLRLSGSQEKVSSFGHPYIRHLCSQVPDEWKSLDQPEDTLLGLVRDIAVYCIEHSAESEACDMLMEIERIGMMVDLVSEDIYDRVCLYLTSCVKYVPEPEDSVLLNTALKIYRRFHQFPLALRTAMMLNDHTLIREIFMECPDRVMRKQLAFMLGRQQVFLDVSEDCEDGDDLVEIMSNVHLNNNFLALGRELDIMEPKVPEDIYKTHLEHARFSTASSVDSAHANLAASFVNGFVNSGFGSDKLLTEDGNKWLYKHKKDFGMLSATASLGLVLLWDVEGGLTQIDKFLYSNEDYVKSGALLACGIVNSGVRNECDPALALLSDYILHASNTMRLGAVIGLGLAYAGSQKEEIIEELTPVLWNATSSLEVVCLGALSCALIAVGSCHGDLTESFVQIMIERDVADLSKTYVRFLALGLALLHLGKQEAMEATKVALSAVPEPLCSFATTLLEICAYAGTGDVLRIQSLLHTCSEFHAKKDSEAEKGEESGAGPDKQPEGKEEEVTPVASTDNAKPKDGKKPAAAPKSQEKEKGVEPHEPGSINEPGSHQAISVLGIALIAMGEDIGGEMALRSFSHLLRYGDAVVRRSVPLALSLLSTSHPNLSVLDTLSKLSHDSDSTVARNAIFAMGVVGSGTNNARLAGLLRNLAQFYHKEHQDLFMVRLAQGLTHLGKGTLTLNPYHSDRLLMSPVAVAGLMVVQIAMLDATNLILKDAHYMLFYLTPAIQPRMLVTFDEDLNPLPVSVRVGQAVDVVGQAGKPKTITGFQTHTTPVLLAYGERAELASDEYVPLTPIVEGFVILRKNPDYTD